MAEPTAHPPRREPLRARPPADAPPAPADEPVTRGRGILLVTGVALGVGVAVLGLVYAIVAIPMYLLAQSDPDGLDAPFVRKAFFTIALPAGALCGIAAGAAVGTWLAKGGRLPSDRSDIHAR